MAASAQPVVQTTAFTRYLLLSPDAATARSRLGITNLTTLISFDTNIFQITNGTNITLVNPIILTNVVLVGGSQGLTYDPNIFQLAGTNLSLNDPLVLTNVSLGKNTISPVVNIGSQSGSIQVDASLSTEFKVSLAGSLMINFTNWTDGHPIRLREANTGNFTLTFSNSMYWYPNGNTTQVTNDWGNGISDSFAFWKDGGTIFASDKEGVGVSGAGSVSGGGVATEVAYWSAATALTGNTNMEYAANQLILKSPTATPGTPLLVRSDDSDTTFPLEIENLNSASGKAVAIKAFLGDGTNVPINAGQLQFEPLTGFNWTTNHLAQFQIYVPTAANPVVTVESLANVKVGKLSVVNSASQTNGFLYLPFADDTPTLIPNYAANGSDGRVPIIVDTNNLALWFYSRGQWRAIATINASTNIIPGPATASVGLTAVVGSSTNYMRADAAPKLSQQIAPTWRDQHIFDRGIIVGTNTPTNLGGIGGTTNGEVFVAVFDQKLSDPSRVYQLIEVATDLQNSSELASFQTFVNSTNAYALLISSKANTDANFVQLVAATNNAALNLVYGGLAPITNSLSASTNLAKLRMADATGDSITLALDTTAPSLVMRVASQAYTTLNPSAADGATPYTMDSAYTHTLGKLFDVQNASVSKFAVDYTGSPIIPLNAVSGYVLKSDGAGRGTWQTAAGSVAGGIQGSVQFNNAGGFGGSDSLIYQDNSESLTLGGADTAGPVVNLRDSGGTLTTLQPNSSDGVTSYFWDTSIAHTSAYQSQWYNGGTEIAGLSYNGGLSLGNSAITLVSDNLISGSRNVDSGDSTGSGFDFTLLKPSNQNEHSQILGTLDLAGKNTYVTILYARDDLGTTEMVLGANETSLDLAGVYRDAVVFDFNPTAPNLPLNTAYLFDTAAALTDSAARLASFRNAGVEKFGILPDGTLNIGTPTNQLYSSGKDLVYTNGAPGGPSFYVRSGAGYTRLGLNASLQSIITSADNSSIALTAGNLCPGGLGTMDLGVATSEHFRDGYFSRDFFLMRDLVWNSPTNNVFDLAGSGSPNGVTAGSPGSLYRNYAGGPNTTIYAKTTGTGNTGWTPLGNSVYGNINVAQVANSTNEGTLLASSVVGIKTLPANYLTAGKTLKVKLRGLMRSTAAPTLQIRAYLGTTNIADTGAVTLVSSASTRTFDVDLMITCGSVGASGIIYANGRVSYFSTATALQNIDMPDISEAPSGAGITTVDTTASQVLNITATWGTAATGNDVTIFNGIVEAVF